MKINYKITENNIIEVEVSDEVGLFYLESLEKEKKNDRRETRNHTYLSSFEYEDVRFFDSGVDIARSSAETDAVRYVIGKLTERERYLILEVYSCGKTYTEIAKSEGKSPSTIMRETNKVTDKFKEFYQKIK